MKDDWFVVVGSSDNPTAVCRLCWDYGIRQSWDFGQMPGEGWANETGRLMIQRINIILDKHLKAEHPNHYQIFVMSRIGEKI